MNKTTQPVTLERLMRFAIIAAHEVNSNPNLLDDAIQEGQIAAWVSLTRYPDKPQGYHTKTIKRAVSNVYRGRPFTGQPRQQGVQRIPADMISPLVEHGESDGQVYVAEPGFADFSDALVEFLDYKEETRNGS